MGHKKLIRFAEMETFANVIQPGITHKGNWHNYYNNNNNIIVELACGKGEYTVGLAKLYPTPNYIGVDVKGNRMWVGAKKCIKENITNVAFIRTQIDLIQQHFATNEVSEIWITFPDPQLRWSKMNRRLTHPKFLRFYKTFLKPGGLVHLKTDSTDLYNFTKKVIELYNLKCIDDNNDVHHTEVKEELKIKTHYEGLNISGSNKIYYLCFTVDAIGNNKDEALKAFFKPTEIV